MKQVLRAAAAGAAAMAAGPAFAHHAMDGRMPGNAAEGFLSGLAHPVIGPDHLAFVVGIGILAAFAPRRGSLLPLAFLLAGAAGAALHVAGQNLPAGEMLVALSVLLMAGAVATFRRLPEAAMAALCGLGGLVHGYALAESIVGAEPSPLWAYFAGLVVVQLAISLAVRELVRRLAASRPSLVANRVALATSAAILAVGIALPLALSA